MYRHNECEGFQCEQRMLEADLEAARDRQGPIEQLVAWMRKRSLFVLAFGTGCGAIEMRPLMTSRFDAERFGIVNAATPRQADVLVISGYLAIKTLKRVIRSYEQMQEPKYVIALGSCTINGGMYWDSYNTVKQVDRYLPVDMYVNGCMPRPEALIEGFVSLQKRIARGEPAGYQRYREQIDWYKANQRRVLGDNMLPDYTYDWYYAGGIA
ncbi:NADH-quinone oxidoreductase, B subunit [Thioflavicoccus mobilis 8321]|uniref:NADH-quinone oxidoreductase, B subunit n=1 Tax=Thioflavicoccus mobilis 8321 TaxID=765912 RepID=L0GYV2_9GAMM|nr:NADH-quinone oxidoreductase subunit B [Thioflavicoccus mobilis]AGA91146.1 NADH-quinone oxidoreductase, B subunit [Thioflavicoccus mobilis 8321]